MHENSFFNEQYLVQLRNGDEEIAKHFVVYFRRSLRRWLWGKFSRGQEDELIDSAIVSAYEKISQGQPRDASKLPSYVRGICMNLTRLPLRPSFNRPGLDAEEHPLPDDAHNAEELLLERERAREVRKVLESLSVRDRDILVGLFYEDKDRDEVCREHGVNRGKLRLILFRTRQRFQKVWKVKVARGKE